MATPDLSQTLTARFLAATTATRSRRNKPAPPPVENDEFLLMLWRMVRALERRMIDDPTLLPQADQLRERLAQAVNVAIYGNAERYSIDPRHGASQAECGRILGASKQAASQRGQRGKAVMLARHAAAGVIPFADAREERRIIVATATEAVTVLSEYRARKAG